MLPGKPDERDDEEEDWEPSRPEGKPALLWELELLLEEGNEGMELLLELLDELGKGELELDELLLEEELLAEGEDDELLLALGLEGELELEEDVDGIEGEEELLDWLCSSSQALTVSPSMMARTSERSFNASLIEGAAMAQLRFKYR